MDDYEGSSPVSSADYEGSVPVSQTSPKSTKTSFGGDMWSNFKTGVSGLGDTVKDIAKGNFIGEGKESPATESLADKIMPQGFGLGSASENIGDALLNIKNNVKLEDVSKAVSEKGGQTVPGEFGNAVMSINPVTNAIGTMYNRRAAPAIEKATGIGPATQGIIAMGLGPKAKAGEKISKVDPVTPITKYTVGKVADAAKATPEALKNAKENISQGIDTMKEGHKARSQEVLDATVGAMEAKASASYKAMREAGVGIVPEVAIQLADKVEKDLEPAGKLDTDLHGGTMKVLADMKAKAISGMDLQDLDIFRKRFRQAAKAGGEEAKVAGLAIDSIDDAVDTMKDKSTSAKGSQAITALQNARAGWAKARAFETVADVINKAQGDPSKLKTAFNNLLNTKAGKAKLRGFSAEEKALVKKASQNSTPESLMALLGKFGFDTSKTVSGNKAPFWATVGAHLMGAPDPALIGVTGAGTMARAGQKLLARGKAENVLKAIESRKDIGNSFNPDQMSDAIYPLIEQQ